MERNPMMLPVGTLLDRRYRIEHYLASGGFGNTYEATDLKLSYHVAVKEFFLSQHSLRSADHCSVTVTSPDARELFDHYRDKFNTEARRISQLHNEHIVRVTDLFEANGTVYYVMDFINGESLKKRIKRDVLDENVAVDICLQVLDALDEIHGAGLYHLDVKPDNIMLTPKGRAVLIDFGASKQMDAAGGATLHSQMVYTPGYAPSEQLEGKADRIGPWTDFYALGATLYAMLTGHTPPSSSDITDDGEDAFQFLPGNQEPLRQAVLKMMMLSTKKRPQTIAEVKALLAAPSHSTAEEVTVEINDAATRIWPHSHLSSSNPSAHRQALRLEERVFTVGGVSFKMIAVEGGTFMMGATPEQESKAFPDEKPAHQVTLSSYMIGETVVTQALWKAVMGDNPSRFKGNDLPVESVSWNDCQRFTDALNRATEGMRPAGRLFRLPTEAEWEFAARGGNMSRQTKYAGSNDIDAVAWYAGNSNTSKSWLGKVFSGGNTHPVAQKNANELGLYDMSGNEWEWCQDWYDERYYDESPSTNPCNNVNASFRVYRGGGWGNNAEVCRVSSRGCDTSDSAYDSLGLRLAL